MHWDEIGRKAKAGWEKLEKLNVVPKIGIPTPTRALKEFYGRLEDALVRAGIEPAAHKEVLVLLNFVADVEAQKVTLEKMARKKASFLAKVYRAIGMDESPDSVEENLQEETELIETVLEQINES